MMSKLTNNQHNVFFYGALGLVSIFISLWMNAHHAILNSDGICYLLSAEAISTGMTNAMHLCAQAAWPFYSFLIWSVVKITHVSYLNAAFGLNAFFTMISVITFVAIVGALGGNRFIQYLAAAVILFAPEWNKVREYVIRDHGFWACYLISVLLLLHYFKRPTWRLAIGWGLSLIVATLFRVEGAFFLIALPWLFLVQRQFSWAERLRGFFSLQWPVLLCALALSSWLVLHPQTSIDQFGRLQEIVNQLHHGVGMFFERYAMAKKGLADNVLSTFAAGDAGLVLGLLFIVWYLASVLGNVSWFYSGLVVYAWVTRALRLTKSAGWVLAGYLAINVVITMCFLVENRFLSKRYLIAESLIFMLWVPFALAALWQLEWRRYRMATAAFVFVVFASIVSSLISFGYSKDYLVNAGTWLAHNVPVTAIVYTNNEQILYYSEHHRDVFFRMPTRYTDARPALMPLYWKNYDYIALLSQKHEKNGVDESVKEMNILPLQIYQNKRGDRVTIYKVQHEEKKS